MCVHIYMFVVGHQCLIILNYFCVVWYVTIACK